jgi:hypothetical protein
LNYSTRVIENSAPKSQSRSMNNELSVKKGQNSFNRLKWIGFILMASGSLSFSNHTLVGDMIAVLGIILFLGTCIYSRLKR